MADKIAKLKSIANLRDTGIMSEREFKAAKAKILSEHSPSKTNQDPRSPIRPCAICNKEFTWATLAKYGGSVCGKCFKTKCKCKICEVEKTVSEMWGVEDGPLCRICYIPTALSYLTYLFAFIYILTFSWFLALVILSVFVLGFWAWVGLDLTDDNDGLKTFSKAHNYTIGPSSVRKSSMFIVGLAIILCIILAWTLASPWFVYTVNYEHAYSVNEQWGDYQGEAFTHEHYLGYMWVDIDGSEWRWKASYQELTEETNYPWYSNSTSNPFWLDYGEDENFKHRDYVSSVTLGLGIVSLAGYVLSIIIGFIFYRMTTKLEPNFLYLKSREKFQSQVNSFAKKITHMKKKGIVVSSLNPYLNELGKMSASEDGDDINVNNPLNTLYLMILCMMVGILFSASAVLFYTQNWYEAVLDDGLDGIWQDSSGWTMTSWPYYFTGNYRISPMITFLSFSIVLGLILVASHVIFLHRSCYNMITEIIDSSSRTSDFKISSELLIDTEEPLTTTKLPDPGEGILAEIVEAEPESVDGEN